MSFLSALPLDISKKIITHYFSGVNNAVHDVLHPQPLTKNLIHSCNVVLDAYTALFKGDKEPLSSLANPALPIAATSAKRILDTIDKLMLPLKMLAIIACECFHAESEKLGKGSEPVWGHTPLAVQAKSTINNIWNLRTKAMKEMSVWPTVRARQEDYEMSELSFMVSLKGVCDWTIRFYADISEGSLVPKIKVHAHILYTRHRFSIYQDVPIVDKHMKPDFVGALDTILREKSVFAYMLLYTKNMNSWIRSPFSIFHDLEIVKRGAHPSNFNRMAKRVKVMNSFIANICKQDDEADIAQAIEMQQSTKTVAEQAWAFQERAFNGDGTRINHILLAQTLADTIIKPAMLAARTVRLGHAYHWYAKPRIALEEWFENTNT